MLVRSMNHVILFDHDPAFSQAIVDTFAGYGIPVEVTQDGSAGIAAAEANEPALALITVELPSMQGYKICKRFKKSARLSHVPVVMLSAEPGAEDTFANHRKLRMRADDYILKPISGAELYEAVKGLIVGRATQIAPEASPPPADFDYNDEPTAIHTLAIDAEIEAFAENAFAQQVTPDSAPPASVGDAADDTFSGADSPFDEESVSVEIDTVQLDDDEMNDLEAEVQAIASEAPFAEELAAEVESLPPSHPPSSDSSGDSALSEALSQAQAKVASLEQELVSARDAAASSASSGTSSSREILDLREQLNGKDRQLLQLRDEMGSRDKEVLDLKDRLLQLERANAEQAESLEQSQRKLSDSEQRNQVLQTDHEAFQKRLEDFKGRLDRSDAKGRELEETLETERSTHHSALEKRQADHDIAIAEMEQSHSDALESQSTAAREAQEAAAGAHAAAIETVRAESAATLQETQQLHDTAIQHTNEAHQGEIESLRSNHQNAIETMREEASSEKERALSELREELDELRKQEVTQAQEAATRALEEAQQDHASALSQREAELAREHESATEANQAQHAQELAVLSRKLTEAESRAEEVGQTLATTTADLEQARASIESLTASKSNLEGQVNDTSARLAGVEAELTMSQQAREQLEDRLSRVAKAMAVGLSIIDEPSAEASASPPADDGESIPAS